jgi:hypothetical protein
MLVSYHPSHGGDECIEGPLLVGAHSPTFGGELVDAAALAGLLDPGAFDPPALLEAIQQRLQGVDMERQLATGPHLNQLAELVAVPRTG